MEELKSPNLAQIIPPKVARYQLCTPDGGAIAQDRVDHHVKHPSPQLHVQQPGVLTKPLQLDLSCPSCTNLSSVFHRQQDAAMMDVDP